MAKQELLGFPSGGAHGARRHHAAGPQRSACGCESAWRSFLRSARSARKPHGARSCGGAETEQSAETRVRARVQRGCDAGSLARACVASRAKRTFARGDSVAAALTRWAAAWAWTRGRVRSVRGCRRCPPPRNATRGHLRPRPMGEPLACACSPLRRFLTPAGIAHPWLCRCCRWL